MAYLRLLRPHHWIKNLLLFAPLIFSGNFFSGRHFLNICLGAIVFSLIASTVYILNDIADQVSDRMHPEKKCRPIAAGMISPREGYFIALFIGLFAFIVAWYLKEDFFFLLLAYLFGNLLYSLWLKRMPILDLLIVASFYLMRIFAGGVLIDVRISSLLILTTFSMALFIIATKRRQELSYAGGVNVVGYAAPLLDIISSAAIAGTIIFYVLYILSKPVLFLWTIPFVAYAIFRYAYLIYSEKKNEEPIALVLHDWGILVALFGWVSSVFMMLYIL